MPQRPCQIRPRRGQGARWVFAGFLGGALLPARGAARAGLKDLAEAAVGPRVEWSEPPAGASSWPEVCSVRHPICVHAPDAATAPRALDSLAAADRAWDALTGALGLPPPDRDLDGAWHVYLVDDPALDAAAQLRWRDPRSRFDRGITFGVVDRGVPAGCALDFALARAVSQAAALEAAPATDDGSALAEAEMLARLAVPCRADEAVAAVFQEHPERAIVDPSSVDYARGAANFFDWLDESFGRDPAALVRGLWALAPTRTGPDAARWSASPTGFDVLRVSLAGALGTASNLDDIFGAFAVDRLRETPAPRSAWHVPWPLKPRRLASPEPVCPTGASYVVIDHEGAPAGEKLRLEAEWEDYGRMRWFAAKLGPDGRTSAVVPVTSLERGTRASMTIEGLDGVSRVVVVGANTGSTEHRFDPAQGQWEPHGWLLTVSSE